MGGADRPRDLDHRDNDRDAEVARPKAAESLEQVRTHDGHGATIAAVTTAVVTSLAYRRLPHGEQHSVRDLTAGSNAEASP
jgi:hypothetical protein